MVAKRLSLAAVAAAMVALGACNEVDAPSRAPAYGFLLPGAGVSFRWPAEWLPVRYWVSPAAGPVRDYTGRGLRMWEGQFLYREFTGVIVSDSASADVLISVTGATPPDVPLTNDPPVDACGGVTRVDYTVDRPRLDGPFVVSVTWDPRQTDTDVANCLARITSHEIGHTLGLFEHSLDDLDLMNAFPRVAAASAGDRQTVEFLYHVPVDIEPPVRPR